MNKADLSDDFSSYARPCPRFFGPSHEPHLFIGVDRFFDMLDRYDHVDIMTFTCPDPDRIAGVRHVLCGAPPQHRWTQAKVYLTADNHIKAYFAWNEGQLTTWVGSANYSDSGLHELMFVTSSHYGNILYDYFQKTIAKLKPLSPRTVLAKR